MKLTRALGLGSSSDSISQKLQENVLCFERAPFQVKRISDFLAILPRSPGADITEQYSNRTYTCVNETHMTECMVCVCSVMYTLGIHVLHQ